MLGSDHGVLIAVVTISLILGSGFWMLLRERLAELLKALLFWAVLVAALAAAYSYRADLQESGERMLAELIPGRPVQVGHTVLVARGHGGDFTISVRVNDAPVAMVLDTGASSIVLTQEAARAAGLPLDMLAYTVDIDTANGHSRAAAVALDRVAVGSIEERAVSALVAPEGRLKQSLLGMSFLNRLESYEMRGDKLLMHAKP